MTNCQKYIRLVKMKLRLSLKKVHFNLSGVIKPRKTYNKLGSMQLVRS